MFFDDMTTWLSSKPFEIGFDRKEQEYNEQLIRKMELTIKGWSENGVVEKTVDLKEQSKKELTLMVVSDNTDIVPQKSRARLTIV